MDVAIEMTIEARSGAGTDVGILGHVVTALDVVVVGPEDGIPVLLHASLGRRAVDLVPLAAALAGHGFRAVAVEPRSSGDLTTVTLHHLAADLADTADDLGIGRFHAVGHAFGNRVVRCLAADAPELVRTVVLLGAGGRVHAERDVRAALNRCFELGRPPADRLADLEVAFFAPGNDASVWLDGWDAAVLELQIAAMRATEPDDWWHGGSAPMLVVQGLQDRAAPPENGRGLVAERPRTELVEIDGAGHALLPEQPAAVADAVRQFLEAHDDVPVLPGAP